MVGRRSAWSSGIPEFRGLEFRTLGLKGLVFVGPLLTVLMSLQQAGTPVRSLNLGRSFCRITLRCLFVYRSGGMNRSCLLRGSGLPPLTQSFKRQHFQALRLSSVLAGRTPPPI